jgi:hypothetical protein
MHEPGSYWTNFKWQSSISGREKAERENRKKWGREKVTGSWL